MPISPNTMPTAVRARKEGLALCSPPHRERSLARRHACRSRLHLLGQSRNAVRAARPPHDELSAPAPFVCHCLSGTCAVTGCFHWVLVASELIPCPVEAGWAEKPKEFKALTSLCRAAGVLGRLRQSYAEAGSHPVKNSVISSSCEGFEATAAAPACLRRRAHGPNVARFLVKSDGPGDTIRAIADPSNGSRRRN